MTKHVLFIQGGGAGAYAEDAGPVAKLRELLGPAYEVRYPQMPNEDEPDYAAWKAIIADDLTRAGESALVGHSIGGSVIARYLTERPHPALFGIFLIASPFWHDDAFWHWKEVELPRDAAARFPVGVPTFLYHGRDDEFVPLAHVEMYAALFPQATVRRLAGRNHMLNEDLSEVAEDIRRVGRGS